MASQVIIAKTVFTRTIEVKTVRMYQHLNAPNITAAMTAFLVVDMKEILF